MLWSNIIGKCTRPRDSWLSVHLFKALQSSADCLIYHLPILSIYGVCGSPKWFKTILLWNECPLNFKKLEDMVFLGNRWYLILSSSQSLRLNSSFSRKPSTHPTEGDQSTDPTLFVIARSCSFLPSNLWALWGQKQYLAQGCVSNTQHGGQHSKGTECSLEESNGLPVVLPEGKNINWNEAKTDNNWSQPF